MIKRVCSVVLCAALFSLSGAFPSVGAEDSSSHPGKEGRAVESVLSDSNGTFILRDLRSGKTEVYNRKRAKKRQPPESTFKVPNALIGLTTGAVRDEYDVKRWDGVERQFEDWNRDHTLGSGMRHSVVWYYQAMARDIGGKKMQMWIDRIGYGNRDISGGIDQFWLHSTLKISPLEQADFMEKLYKERLPFEKPVMKTVKRMMILEEEDRYTLYGKTGSNLAEPSKGWFTGFIVTDGHPYVFVTNLDGDGAKAKQSTLEILRARGLLPKSR